MNTRRWLASVGAGSLLLTGVAAGAPFDAFAQTNASSPSADESKATDIALKEYPDATVSEIDSSNENGSQLWEVDLSNGVELKIDLSTQKIVETDTSGGSDAAGDDGEANASSENGGDQQGDAEKDEESGDSAADTDNFQNEHEDGTNDGGTEDGTNDNGQNGNEAQGMGSASHSLAVGLGSIAS